MVAIDIATLLVIIGAVVAGITAFSSHHAQTKAISAAPDHRLGRSVRLIDRMIQGHESGMAMLPKEMLEEAQSIVDEYYRNK